MFSASSVFSNSLWCVRWSTRWFVFLNIPLPEQYCLFFCSCVWCHINTNEFKGVDGISMIFCIFSDLFSSCIWGPIHRYKHVYIDVKKKSSNFYLRNREIYKEIEVSNVPFHCPKFLQQSALGQVGTNHWEFNEDLHVGDRTQILEPSPTACQGAHQQDAGIGSRAVIWTQVNVPGGRSCTSSPLQPLRFAHLFTIFRLVIPFL